MSPQLARDRTASRALATSISLVGVLWSAGATAGNHFFLEGAGGPATPLGRSSDAGLGGGGGLTFGVGGRWAGTRPVWYVTGRVALDALAEQGPAHLGSAEVRRRGVELGLGGRVYLPVAGPRLRWFGEVGGGERLESAEVTRSSHPALTVQTQRLQVFAQTGLQWRLWDALSVGGALDWAWMPDQPGVDLAALAAGDSAATSTAGRARALATVTVHF